MSKIACALTVIVGCVSAGGLACGGVHKDWFSACYAVVVGTVSTEAGNPVTGAKITMRAFVLDHDVVVSIDSTVTDTAGWFERSLQRVGIGDIDARVVLEVTPPQGSGLQALDYEIPRVLFTDSLNGPPDTVRVDLTLPPIP